MPNIKKIMVSDGFSSTSVKKWSRRKKATVKMGHKLENKWQTSGGCNN